jgi:cytochrome b subunit of formate dehydrogenase
MQNFGTVTVIPTPFYRSTKFWAIASSIAIVGVGITGAVMWRRRA